MNYLLIDKTEKGIILLFVLYILEVVNCCVQLNFIYICLISWKILFRWENLNQRCVHYFLNNNVESIWNLPVENTSAIYFFNLNIYFEISSRCIIKKKIWTFRLYEQLTQKKNIKIDKLKFFRDLIDRKRTLLIITKKKNWEVWKLTKKLNSVE